MLTNERISEIGDELDKEPNRPHDTLLWNQEFAKRIIKESSKLDHKDLIERNRKLWDDNKFLYDSLMDIAREPQLQFKAITYMGFIGFFLGVMVWTFVGEISCK